MLLMLREGMESGPVYVREEISPEINVCVALAVRRRGRT